MLAQLEKLGKRRQDWSAGLCVERVVQSPHYISQSSDGAHRDGHNSKGATSHPLKEESEGRFLTHITT